MKTRSAPLLVAIVGGSGSGKTWLADALGAALGKKAARMSLDDFYLDRSHLPAARRARINYDHPRAIDWPRLEQALTDLRAGRSTRAPQYDFKNHARRRTARVVRPAPLLLLDGLWLLRRPKLRRVFHLTIFIECPAQTRLARRLARDSSERGRTAASIRRQFWEMVEPMHRQHVAPQSQQAEFRLKSPAARRDVRRLAELLLARLDRLHDAG